MITKPPPSLSDLGTLTGRVLDSIHRKTVENPTISFDCDFAPSSSDMKVHNPEQWINARTRSLAYNDQLYDALEETLNRAHGMGAPFFPFLFPLGLSPLKTGLSHFPGAYFVQQGANIIENLNEHTEDWLCMACYISCGMAAHHDEEAAPNFIVADAMFKVGAILRELELVRLNRTDARRGRKTKRAAREGGLVRKAQESPETTQKLHEMARLIDAGHSVSRAAELAAAKGLGTTAGNRKLWYAHR